MTTKRQARRAPAKKTPVSAAQSVLDAAITEFLEKGFDGANVRSILAASGASAGSVYRRFGSKEGLFREIIEKRIDLSYPRTVKLRVDSELPMEEELARFAKAYLREFLSPESLSTLTMAISQAANFPEESRRLWEVGANKAVEQVEAYLRHHQEQGSIEVEDVHLAAAQFLDMIKAGLHVRQLLTGDVPSTREIDANVRQAVKIFCRGIATTVGAAQ